MPRRASQAKAAKVADRGERQAKDHLDRTSDEETVAAPEDGPEEGRGNNPAGQPGSIGAGAFRSQRTRGDKIAAKKWEVKRGRPTARFCMAFARRCQVVERLPLVICQNSRLLKAQTTPHGPRPGPAYGMWCTSGEAVLPVRCAGDAKENHKR